MQNEATRRMAEDKLPAKNPAFRASYMVLGPNQKDLNEDSIKAIVARDGYDGVVSMQLIDVQKLQATCLATIKVVITDGIQ